MATTPLGTQLTTQHRARQLQLRSVLLRRVVAIWPAFNLRAIDQSWEAIEPALMAIVAEGRAVSGALAGAYYRAFREAERIQGPFRLPTLTDDWRPAAQVSLQVTGPVTAKQLITLRRPDAAAQTLVHLSGAVGRHALNGGRDMVRASVREDRRALGWARVTDFDPCAFCAMLASRGPVYSETGGDFQAHDHCACTLEPVYRRSQAWPGRSREFQDIWRKSTRGTKGKDSLNAFRRALGGR